MQKFSFIVLLFVLLFAVSCNEAAVQDQSENHDKFLKVVAFTVDLQNSYTGVVVKEGFEEYPKDLIINSTVNGSPITGIDNFAFDGYIFDSITLPSTIQYIGPTAFLGSTTKVRIPKNHPCIASIIGVEVETY